MSRVLLLGTLQRANGDRERLDRESWRVLFASLVVDDQRLLARVCLNTPEGESAAGAREHARPLRTLRYDAEADEIEIGVGPERIAGTVLRFFVSAPRSIVVEAAGAATRVRVVDIEGLQTVIGLSREQAVQR